MYLEWSKANYIAQILILLLSELSKGEKQSTSLHNKNQFIYLQTLKSIITKSRPKKR